jgi:ComF family protein
LGFKKFHSGKESTIILIQVLLNISEARTSGMNPTRQNALKASRSSSMARRMLRRLVTAVVEAVFPVKCLVCGCFIHPQDEVFSQNLSILTYSGQCEDWRANGFVHHLMQPYLCADCTRKVAVVKPPFCLACGFLFKSNGTDDGLCGDCITSPKKFRVARAPVVYDEAFMNLVLSLKYRGKIQLAKPLGGLLLVAFLQYWDVGDIDIVTPVPLYQNRFKQRGFNQAFVLIQNWEELAEELNADLTGLQFERQVLIRNRATATQTGLGRKERMHNIKNAFSVPESHKIAGKRVLLVDDVYTTGATVDECSRELIKHGAACVDVLTVARAM